MPGAKMPAFDWDDANSAHVSRHGVTPAEAEQVVLGASRHSIRVRDMKVENQAARARDSQ